MTAYADLPTATAAEGDSTPVLAWNLEAVKDWSTQMPFLDIARTMRPWSGIPTDGTPKLNYQALAQSGVLDENGWPISMPEGLKQFVSIWSWGGAPDAADSRAGVYVLTYEGEGDLRLHLSAEVLESEPGRIVFETSGLGSVQLIIEGTDPNGTGDYIRDISVVREDHVDLVEAGAIFNPDFLARIQDAGQLRFMDWMEVNNSEMTQSWADRPTLDQATWMNNGVPVEIMVELANQAGTDPWFTMPHGADAEYVREFATYVRDHLDPRLTASVEFSNETWNWAFDQTKDLRDMAVADWGVAPDDWKALVHYQAKLATEMAMVWDDVFGEEADARLVKVLGAWAGSVNRSNDLLDPVTWFELEPETAVAPDQVFDALAVTTYFGNRVTAKADQRAELLAAIQDPDVDAMTWLHDKLLDPTYSSSVPQTLAALARQKAVAEDRGLDLIAYEGGQHVHTMKAANNAELDAFMRDFVRSEQMADLYQHLFDGWAEIGDGPFMQFVAVGSARASGSWGLRTSLGDENPRAELLDRLGAETDPWWDGAEANDAYLHGVTRTGDEGGAATDDVLVGTVEEDFLIGRHGDDILVGGAGNDGLNGGAGDDLAVFAGAAIAYVIEAEGDGWRLTGPDGSDYLINVERLLFEDGTEITPEALALAQTLIAAPNLDDDAVPANPANPANPADPVAPEAAATVTGLSELVVLDAAGACRAETGEVGLLIDAVNRASALGQELRAAGEDPEATYLVAQKGFQVEIGGVAVTAAYASLQENRIGKDGAPLSGTALETSEALAALVRDAAGIHGSDFNDTMFGRRADDVLHGEGGRDWLQSRDGDDVLAGGTGDDALTGGAGADVFVFAAGDGRDVIRDFSVAEGDRLELHGLGEAALTGQDLAEMAWIDGRGRVALDFGDDRILFEGLEIDDLAGAQIDWLAAA